MKQDIHQVLDLIKRALSRSTTSNFILAGATTMFKGGLKIQVLAWPNISGCFLFGDRCRDLQLKTPTLGLFPKPSGNLRVNVLHDYLCLPKSEAHALFYQTTLEHPAREAPAETDRLTFSRDRTRWTTLGINGCRGAMQWVGSGMLLQMPSA